MKIPAQRCPLWMLFVFCVQSLMHGKDEPKWEIETRTLAHAPDGSPDSRSTFGIGEWVEIKIVPETIANVEWMIKGGSMVTNRFGNPSILIVGYDGGEFSLEANVYEEPHADVADSKDAAAKSKWLGLVTALQTLEKVAAKPAEFESHCEAVQKTLYPLYDQSSIQALEMGAFIRLLGEMDRLSPGFPDAYSWARLRGAAAEASALRLGVCLDSTADKSKLEPAFWDLLRACVTNLENLNKQFEAAGGEANSTARIFSGPPPFAGYNPMLGKNAVANALSNRLSTLPFLLYVQVRNALPGASANKIKEVLLERGFTQEEIARLLKAAK